MVSQLTSSVSSESCEPLSFPLISSIASLSPSAQQAPVHNLPVLPHPWEVQLFRHTIKRTMAMAFKPLPHLPFFQGFVLHIMTLSECQHHTYLHLQSRSLPQSCICTNHICTYCSAPDGAHCLSGLHSFPLTS